MVVNSIGSVMMDYAPAQPQKDELKTNLKPSLKPGSQLFSVTIRIPFVDGLTFLRQAPHEVRRIYWENDRLEWRYAGFGVTAEITADGSQRFTSIKAGIEKLFADASFHVPEGTPKEALPRLFGGFSFQPDTYRDHSSDLWTDFSDARFVLPKFMLATRGRESWLTVSTIVKDGEASLHGVEQQLHREARDFAACLVRSHDIASMISSPALISRNYPLTQTRWRHEIIEATDRIKAGALDKVVLARICDLQFNQRINPLQALAQLQQRYAETYRFLIEPQAGHYFFGATPELLIAKHGHQLVTAALAGSTRRGETTADDDRMAAVLFQSAKERHEHHLVKVAIEEALLPLTTKLDVPESPQILKLSNIQHLYTPIMGTLKSGQTLLDAVEKLHPTPAVGGYPGQIAVELIGEIEQFPRGWYASPVGWIDAQGDGLFAVALRSAVVRDDQARLYAGVGIVADSDPDREWDETTLKFRPMLNALGVEA
jgi:menaquinone-specific isochorismate synthase